MTYSELIQIDEFKNVKTSMDFYSVVLKIRERRTLLYEYPDGYTRDQSKVIPYVQFDKINGLEIIQLLDGRTLNIPVILDLDYFDKRKKIYRQVTSHYKALDEWYVVDKKS